MKVLLFGGTAEGRALAEWLREEGIPFTVCVATGYGETLLPADVDARVGRLGREEMAALMEDAALVVDATHPYATAVTENIRAAATQVNTPCLRLLRPALDKKDGIRVPNMEAAARTLETLPGNALLTTGSKELDVFARPGLVERCYPRVLPMPDSLTRCLDLGFPPAHVLCMQGPFSKELNAAMLRQFEIRTLVTKDTGSKGGFPEKAGAARECGCALLVVDRPSDESGLTLEALKTEIGRRLG